jgi:DNA-binding PadR family transcriptional regulator
VGVNRGVDVQSLLPLHPLEFRILLVLLEGPNHGYEIVRSIEAVERAGAVYPANLYRRIRDLLAKELVAEAGSPRGREDTRRRYLEVTPLGRRVARAEAVRLQELVNAARAINLLPT